MKKTFTLIELLVVIAIISILASMLLPALGQAKNKSRTMACGGNLSQIGKAVIMYTNDYDGWMPIDAINGWHRQWKLDISPYLSGVQYDMFSNEVGEGVYACPSSEVNLDQVVRLQGGYGWNYNEMGYQQTDATRKRVKLNSVSIPSETIVAGDTIDWGDNTYDKQVLYYNPSSVTAPIGNRHSKGINLLWADFHMEWMPQNNLMTGQDGVTNYYYLRIKP